ncbi:MAG: hypothetical protein P1V97_37485 [Planctomycetota bacterium]|nr:hypothetical protein [Planctomycetota bacterium]
MSREYSEEEANRHNALTEKAWAIANKYILLLGQEPVKLGFFKRRQLNKAVRCFEEAITIAPENYSSYWAVGKIYQAMEKHSLSLKWFEEAWKRERENADVSRETSLAAMDCQEFPKALFYAGEALSARPKDPGLLCNYALCLMFLSRDHEALDAVAESINLDSNDEITKFVQEVIQAVVAGKRARPLSMKEI